MKTQTAHAPTPYQIDVVPDANAFTTIRKQLKTKDEFGDLDSQPIATVYKKSDAAFIVRAVNAHEEMLATLKQVRKWMIQEDSHDLTYHMRAVEETIAKASLV